MDKALGIDIRRSKAVLSLEKNQLPEKELTPDKKSGGMIQNSTPRRKIQRGYLQFT